MTPLTLTPDQARPWLEAELNRHEARAVGAGLLWLEEQVSAAEQMLAQAEETFALASKQADALVKDAAPLADAGRLGGVLQRLLTTTLRECQDATRVDLERLRAFLAEARGLMASLTQRRAELN